jgi:hypothetical protein
MSNYELNQYVALAGVFAVCMIGVIYHLLATRKSKRHR